MKTGLLIVLSAVVLVISSVLAVMNSACKTSHHTMMPRSKRTRTATRPSLGNHPDE